MRALFVKIREKDNKQRPNKVDYENIINFVDYKILALLLLDLSSYGANIDKAFEEYKKLKQEQFPW